MIGSFDAIPFSMVLQSAVYVHQIVSWVHNTFLATNTLLQYNFGYHHYYFLSEDGFGVVLYCMCTLFPYASFGMLCLLLCCDHAFDTLDMM